MFATSITSVTIPINQPISKHYLRSYFLPTNGWGIKHSTKTKNDNKIMTVIYECLYCARHGAKEFQWPALSSSLCKPPRRWESGRDSRHLCFTDSLHKVPLAPPSLQSFSEVGVTFLFSHAVLPLPYRCPAKHYTPPFFTLESATGFPVSSTTPIS